MENQNYNIENTGRKYLKNMQNNQFLKMKK